MGYGFWFFKKKVCSADGAIKFALTTNVKKICPQGEGVWFCFENEKKACRERRNIALPPLSSGLPRKPQSLVAPSLSLSDLRSSRNIRRV